MSIDALSKVMAFRGAILLSVCLISLVAHCSIAYPQQQNEDPPRIPNVKKDRKDGYQKAVLIEFKGEINQKLLKYFRNRFNWAKRQKADILIIEIDSPGGYLVESMEIANMLKDCNWAHTVAYIKEDAYSGAAMVSFGCDETIMSLEGRIGDIGVIQFDPTLWAFRYAEAKAKSVFIRQARDLAEAKGRSPDLVEAMINQDVAIYMKTKEDGSIEYKKRDILENEELPVEDGDWKLVEESGKNKFLTINGARAVELGVATDHAESREGLKGTLNIDGSLREQSYNFSDGMAHFLANPFITAILIIVGLIALYIELSAPGISAGGLIAGLCALLFFWSRFMGGTSGWLEVVLFVAGIVFLLMEIFVIPGWGISGIMGLLLLFVSVMMAIQGFVWPETSFQWSETFKTLLLIAGSMLVVLIVAGVITRRMGSIPIFNRLMLQPVADADEDEATDGESHSKKPTPKPHPDVSIGDWGTAESVLRPAGRAKFGSVSMDVVSEGSYIEPGQAIRVLHIEGNRIVVELAAEDETVYKKT